MSLVPPKKPWREDDQRELHRQWLDAILQTGVNLTTWEEEFLESIEARLDQGRSLSENQAEKLETIYTERVP